MHTNGLLWLLTILSPPIFSGFFLKILLYGDERFLLFNLPAHTLVRPKCSTTSTFCWDYLFIYFLHRELGAGCWGGLGPDNKAETCTLVAGRETFLLVTSERAQTIERCTFQFFCDGCAHVQQVSRGQRSSGHLAVGHVSRFRERAGGH